MAIAGFDPKEFADSLTGQAREVIPADLPKEDKDFIANTLYRYCMLAGEALVGDETSQLDAQQASIITQFIGEWTFHKSIDLIRSGIPMDKRDPVLQKIAFAVFEESREVIVNNVDQNEAIARVENAVGIAYQEALDELRKQHQLDEELAQKAMQESNIDRMATEASVKEQTQANAQGGGQATSPQDSASRKLLRLAAIAMLLKKMSKKDAGKILMKFPDREAKAISSYMHVDGLEEAFDMEVMRNFMHDFLLTIPQEAYAYTEKQVRQKYTELSRTIPQEELDAVLKVERSKVKKSLENAKNIKEMPTKVSSIVLNYLEEKVTK